MFYVKWQSNLIYVYSISSHVLVFSLQYKPLGDFNPLVIIPCYQIFSIICCIWNITSQWMALTITLRKKCPYLELFWSAFFPYSVRMRKNVGKMRNRITPNMDTFYVVLASINYPPNLLILELVFFLFPHSLHAYDLY